MQHQDHLPYLLRALPLESSQPHLPDLDALFDHFMAVTLSFQDDYAHSPHATHYAHALQQIRQGIRDGGFGLTSARVTAPAASYVTTRDFCKWYSSLALLWSGRAIHTLPWFPPAGPVIIDSQPVLPYALTNFNTASQELQEHWDFSCGDLTDTRDQNTLTTIMKAGAHQRFLDTCSCDAQVELLLLASKLPPPGALIPRYVQLHHQVMIILLNAP